MPKSLKISTNNLTTLRRGQRSSLLKTACVWLLPFFLSACQFDILNPKGQIAADEKQLLLLSVGLMLVVVVPVILLTLVFAWRYRESNTDAKYLPNWKHSTLLEIVWWSIPCAIIAILGTLTWISTYRLDPYRPLEVAGKKEITIQVVALDWKWLFIYPEQNIATVNYIQVPVGVPVNFRITAEGAMNSLQIPQLGGQIYAMAGMKTQLHLIADHSGDYRGFSANFSGDGFSDMNFILHAGSQKEFENWVRKIKRAPEKMTLGTYQRLARPGVSAHAKYYSSASKDLFDAIVMKSMMPMPTKKKGENHAG